MRTRHCARRTTAAAWARVRVRAPSIEARASLESATSGGATAASRWAARLDGPSTVEERSEHSAPRAAASDGRHAH
eukprot:5916935-Prymnesium_polylepis.1